METTLAINQTQFKQLNSPNQDIQESDIDKRECIVEISKTKKKFFIVAVDLLKCEYHAIDVFMNQANKMLKAVDYDPQSLVSFLEFRHDKLRLRDQELLL